MATATKAKTLKIQPLEDRVVIVPSEEAEAKVVQPSSQALAAVRTEQKARLSDYRWVAPDSGVVAVPIERAMALVAGELARQSGEGAAATTPPASGE